MLTWEEAQERHAEFVRAVTDARAREVVATCPLSRTSCAGRSCAFAVRMEVGWICGLTHSRKGARARVVDVDTDELTKGENRLTALTYIERGCLYG